jgi:hypothetical protein
VCAKFRDDAGNTTGQVCDRIGLDTTVPAVLRLRAVDEAGNVSPESAITIVVDNVAPDKPTLAGLPNPINADTVSVNFAGASNTAANDATFDHTLVDTSLLPAPFATNLLDGIVVTLLPDQRNVISVQAVDAAGNISSAASGIVREDSQAPISPTISPTVAEVRTAGINENIPVEIGLLTTATDAFDINNDGTVGPNEFVSVTRYQIKDGGGEGFHDVPGTGPFLANLRALRDNEVCVRGVDDAGNVGAEDCAIISEVTKTAVTSNIDSTQSFDVTGDVMFFASQGGLAVRSISGAFADFVAVQSGTPNAPTGNAHLFATSDARRAFVTYESGSGVVVGTLNLANPTAAGFAVGAIPGGTQPFIRGNALVYMSGTTIRRRVSPFNGADINVATNVSLCQSTSPRTDSGVVIWCDRNNLQRHVIGDAANVFDQLNTAALAPVVRGSLLSSGNDGIQQPQVADGTIA